MLISTFFSCFCGGHWCSKQTTHLKIGRVNASSQIQFQATATCLTARVLKGFETICGQMVGELLLVSVRSGFQECCYTLLSQSF